MSKIFFVFFLCLVKTACFHKNKNEHKLPAQSLSELNSQLEEVLNEMHVPGLSMAIVYKDGPAWAIGLGKADVATGRAATANTLFRIGSVSKGFISLSALKLVEEKKLSLEDPVHMLAPEIWFENRWEKSDPVRMVNLLEHTTGWDDVHLHEYAKDVVNMSLRQALDFDPSSRISRWPPSTRMAYCNSGPPLAAYIIEKITGKNFEAYVLENFFKPIGMKTATYSQPPLKSSTVLYHKDGKTPFPYWNFMYPSAALLNASAEDMTKYLRFYLHRGNVNGTQILPAAAIDRMESPMSTWAAKEGLKAGYGLGNFWSVLDGFVYHGHGGVIAGALTEMAYMKDFGIGYFFSINSGNMEALTKISKVIRAYITYELTKPPIPKEAPLPENSALYAGFYEPDSPREAYSYFLVRLLGLSYVSFKNNMMLISSLKENNASYVPVNNTQFRYVPKKEAPDPVPIASLIKPKAEGTFMQLGAGEVTIKRLPTWLALIEIVTTVFVIISIISILLYAPFWILGGLTKNRRRPKERAVRLLPLIAALSLIGTVVVWNLSIELLYPRMGNLTVWSFLILLGTIIFAAAAIANVIAFWRAPKEYVRKSVRFFSIIVTIALLIATAYLAYWDIIGFRTWA